MNIYIYLKINLHSSLLWNTEKSIRCFELLVMKINTKLGKQFFITSFAILVVFKKDTYKISGLFLLPHFKMKITLREENE